MQMCEPRPEWKKMLENISIYENPFYKLIGIAYAYWCARVPVWR